MIVQFCGCLVRQYRACVIDSLGLGIICVLYHCIMYTKHPNLVSFAIPIFHIQIFIILITIPNLKSADHTGTGIYPAMLRAEKIPRGNYSYTVHVRR